MESDSVRSCLRFTMQCNDALWKSLERGEVTQKDLQTRRFEEVCRQVKKTDVCCEEMNRDYRNFLAECSVMGWEL